MSGADDCVEPLPPSLDGIVCVVTGGTDGIGATTARQLAERKAKVIISGRSEDKGNAVAAEIKASGGSALFIKSDVSIPGDVHSLFDQVVETYGRVDALFNNAGWEGPSHDILDYSAEELSKVYNTNIVGMILAMQCAAKIMKSDEEKSRRKVIINSSSIASTCTKKNSHTTGWYVTTKAAVDAATRVIAGRLEEENIHVYAINPGAVETKMAEELVDRLRSVGINHVKKLAYNNSIGPQRFRLIKPHEIGQVGLGEAATASQNALDDQRRGFHVQKKLIPMSEYVLDQVVGHMIDGTTKWQSGDCVYVGPGATTIHMKNLYREFIYPEDPKLLGKKAAEMRDGYDESKTVPLPL